MRRFVKLDPALTAPGIVAVSGLFAESAPSA